MPTTAERRALWFLAGVITLGGGARAVEAHRVERTVAHADPAALDGQLGAIDSARARQRHPRRGGPRAGTSRRPGAAPATVPAQPPTHFEPSYVAPPLVQSFVPPAYAPRAPEPLSPRIGTALQGAKRWFEAHPLDVDAASAIDLQALPGVGPALAARIVAERNAHGPFGSVDGLERVRGIGPALKERLRALVVFSGVPRIGVRPPVKSASRQRRRSSRG